VLLHSLQQQTIMLVVKASGTAPMQASTTKHKAILTDSLNRLMTALMPDHILHRTKRYLHRKCHKPADMKVRTFHNHLSNMILNELPWLPPFAANQTLANDEVIDILLFATLNSW
jgi:hypothetical protein